jgi:putative ABC transport system permease protein
MALALMLLVGAGLLLRSLDRLLGVDAGFDASDRVVLEVNLSGVRYPKDADVHAMYRRVLENVRATPGVIDVSMTNQFPLSGDFDTWGIHLEARPRANPEEDPSAFRFAVGPSYLRTMGIALVRGRDFTPQDDESSPPVVMINETIARRDFAGMDPIGQRVKIGGGDGPWRTVVGVVRDVRHQGLDQTDERQIYLPSVQNPFADSFVKVVVRTAVDPASIIPTLRQTIRALDPGAPISNAAPMSEVLRRSTAQRRFALLIFGVFAGVALLLAAAGIYGVLAGSVNERTREIGIRTALGAPRERILALIVRQGMALTFAGLVIGVLGALAMSRALRSLLFDIPPYDPLTIAAVSLGLIVVALAAVAVPAWRATRVDALVALRES